MLYDYVNPRNGLRAPLIAEDVYKAGVPHPVCLCVDDATACVRLSRC